MILLTIDVAADLVVYDAEHGAADVADVAADIFVDTAIDIAYPIEIAAPDINKHVPFLLNNPINT